MKFLMIANSFGVNLQTFAKQIAEANNFDLDIYVLYIGGCSLDNHCRNIDGDVKGYELFVNGSSTGKFISIKDALEMDKWDVISLQQASHMCALVDTYYPYFEKVYNYVRELRPDSKIIFHKTWAYSPINSFKYETVPNFYPPFKFTNAKDMKAGLDFSVNKVCTEFGIDTIIRSGDVVEKATAEIGDCYDSQGFHLNEMGCYLIGCHLVKLFSGKPLTNVYRTPNTGLATCERCVEFVNKNF